MEKRGQFYLVAAIIIIGIIFGLVSTKNYIKEIGDDVKIEYLSNEIKEEGARVVDFGTYTGPSEIANFISLVSKDYARDKVQNLVFVYGNSREITKTTYTEEYGSDINLGQTTVNVPYKVEETILVPSSDIEDDEISVTVNQNDYKFKLNSDENFYIILEKEVGNEKYINFK